MSDDRSFLGTDKPFRGAPPPVNAGVEEACFPGPSSAGRQQWSCPPPQHSQVRTLYGPLEALRDPACGRIAKWSPNRVIWVIITAEQQQRRKQRVLLPEVLNELTTNYTCVPKPAPLQRSLHVWPQF